MTDALYLSKKQAYEDTNHDPLASDDERKSAEQKARTLGITNVALTGGAVLGAAVTAVLYFTRPTLSRETTTIAPWITTGSAGHARGSF